MKSLAIPLGRQRQYSYRLGFDWMVPYKELHKSFLDFLFVSAIAKWFQVHRLETKHSKHSMNN